MEVRNCKNCGRLFNYMGGKPICQLCKESLEDKFKEVQEAYTQIMNSRAGGGSGYSQGYSGGYGSGQQGYSNGGYNSGSGQQGYNNGQYNRQSYQNYGQGYGRNPGGYYGPGGCSTGNMCCDLWCADSICECMGGDLCSCI